MYAVPSRLECYCACLYCICLTECCIVITATILTKRYLLYRPTYCAGRL